MSKPGDTLCSLIVKDERERVRDLLQSNPELAQTAMASEPRYVPEIAHWIYVGDSPLHIAAAGYRVEIAKTLLAAGADPNSAQNHRRSQPLHYASDGHVDSPAWNPKRQVALLRLLLQAGADLQAQDKNGATPLHRAVRTRCAAAVKCLLDAGSDPAIWNKPGSTAFHLAVQNTGRGGTGAETAKAAQREIIQAFLDRGVSPAMKDRNGKSVLQWAKSDGIRRLISTDHAT